MPKPSRLRRGPPGNHLAIRDADAFKRILRRVVKESFAGSKSAAARAAAMSVKTLWRLTSRKYASISADVYVSVLRLLEHHPSGHELAADVRACLSNPDARRMLSASHAWEGNDLEVEAALSPKRPFWIFTTTGPAVVTREEIAGWRAAMKARDPLLLAYFTSLPHLDELHLLDRMRDDEEIRTTVLRFERALRARGFRRLMTRNQRARDPWRTTPELLSDASRVNGDQHPFLDQRARLAWRQVLRPLLASRMSPLERSWQEMSLIELRAYVKAATKATLILLNRSPNNERASELTIGIKAHLAAHRYWELEIEGPSQ